MIKIEFQVCEPEDLFWVGTNKTKSVIRVVNHEGTDVSKYDSLSKPNESCIREMFLQAKDLSQLSRQDPDNIIKETFILQDRIVNVSGAKKTFLVARYENGNLDEYCRPSWRESVKNNSRLF